MTSNLGIRPSNAPFPSGNFNILRGVSAGTQAWPGPENFILPGSGGGAQVGTFNRPERFWLKCGASIIAAVISGGWARHDYQLRLVVNGSYGNDLNGINYFQKADSLEGGHANPYNGMCIQGMFFCEANTNYIVYLLSKSSSATSYYYQSAEHYNMWGYTVGEGNY